MMRGAARWLSWSLVAASGVAALLLMGSGPAHAGGAAAIPTVQCSTGLSLALSQPSGPAPLLVTFSLTVLWGTPTWATWNFGDGAPAINGSAAYYLHPSHTYATIGSYVATVLVSDGQRTGACSVGIATTAPALAATTPVTHLSGTVPLTVHLSAEVQGGTGTFTQVGWALGDGHSALGANVSYTYTIPGSYTATFTVVDSSGTQAQVTVTVEAMPASTVQSSPPVDYATITAVGAVLATVAIFGGAALYVRSHPNLFGSGEEDAVDGGDDATALVSQDPTEEVLPEESGLRFPPESYRAVFLDLSDREFDVLAEEPVEERGLAAVRGPSGLVPARPPGPPLSRRVVLHLMGQPQLGPDDLATPAYTQAGMMLSLNVPQSRLSNVLRRLTYSGVLGVQVEHVQGISRRLNVYRLTPKGEQLAVRLQRIAARSSSGDPPGP